MATLEPYNLLIGLLIFGSLLLISFLLISNPLNVNRKANLYFGIFHLLWSTFWFEEIYTLTNLPLLTLIPDAYLHTVQLFTPIFFFLSVRYFTNPYLSWSKKDNVHLVSPFLFLMLTLAAPKFTADFHLFVVLIIVLAVTYSFLSFNLIQRHEKQILWLESDIETIDLHWIKQILYGLLAIILFISIYNVFFSFLTLNFFANLFLLSIILYIAYQSLAQKQIFFIEENELTQILEKEKYDSNKSVYPLFSENEIDTYMNQIREMMERDKPYLEDEISLPLLAQHIDLSPHQLSFLLNHGFGQTFFQFINSYRVEKAKELLSQPKYHHLTMIGVAFEAGFKSKTTFNTVFKKMTGKTPSEFKKTVRLDNIEQ